MLFISNVPFLGIAFLQDEAEEVSYLHSSQGKGDFFVTIFIESLTSQLGGDDLVKAGLMIRETLEPVSRQIFFYFRADGQLRFQSRRATGGETSEKIESNYKLERGQLRLRKIGTTVTGYVRNASKNEWTSLHSIQLDFVNFHVGIAVSSSFGVE